MIQQGDAMQLALGLLLTITGVVYRLVNETVTNPYMVIKERIHSLNENYIPSFHIIYINYINGFRMRYFMCSKPSNTVMATFTITIQNSLLLLVIKSIRVYLPL